MQQPEDERRRHIRRWRSNAEELRTALERMKDPFLRDTFQRLAENYDAIADNAERNSQRSLKRSVG